MSESVNILENKKKLFSEIPFLKNDYVELRRVSRDQAEDLAEFVKDEDIYRYLPTFLYERKYKDINRVIDGLYTECFKESIILGIFLKESFCGLAEMYGYREQIHKISIGYRLLKRYWGKGIATSSLELLVDYLYGETEIEIITASTMVENQASANVLRKNGFTLVSSGVGEDWGYDQPTAADKWIR